jgi:hypothetical protein
MVLGRSIGAAALGESTTGAVAFYGRPRTRRTFRAVGRTLERLTYRLHGGSLWLVADRGVVVAIGTTSPYYTTAAGLGVNADGSAVRSSGGSEWSDCAHAYQRRYGSVDVYIALAGGRNGKTVASVAMTRGAYAYGRCKPTPEAPPEAAR